MEEASALSMGLHLDVKDGGAEGVRTPDPHNAIVVKNATFIGIIDDDM